MVTSHRIDLGFNIEQGAAGANFTNEAGLGASDDWVVWEYCSMSYGKLTFQYNAQQKDGTQGAATIKNFDFTTNVGG